MKRKYKIIIGGVVLLVVAGIMGLWRPKSDAKYNSIEVARGDVVQTVSATGTVESKQKVALKFTNFGQISSINVKVGDTVKKGDVLAQLDSVKLELQLKQAKAALQVAKANQQVLLDGATLEEVNLYKTNVLNAETALNGVKVTTQNEIRNAEAALEGARITLRNVQNNADSSQVSDKNSLHNLYEYSWNISQSALISCDDVVHMTDGFVQDRYLKGVLSARDLSKMRSLEVNQPIAENSYKAAKALRDKMLQTGGKKEGSVQIAGVGVGFSAADLEKLTDLALVALQDSNQALDSLTAVLQMSIASNEVSEVQLASWREMTTLKRGTVSGYLNNLTANKQNIVDRKLLEKTGYSSNTNAVDSARNAVVIAENNLELVKNSAQNSILLRQIELQRANEQLNQIQSKPTTAKQMSYQAQVDQALINVRLAEQQLQDSYIVAPYDGVIASVMGKVGGQITAAEIFAYIMVPNGFEIKANISEVDISKIQVGDTVDITFDAFGSGKKFSGVVSEIDSAETKVSGVVYYQIITDFVEESGVVKSGMTANLDILTQKKEQVIRIPFQALKERTSGEKYVQVVNNNNPKDVKEVEVEIGLRGDSYAEIVSGLQVGQKVVTFWESKK